MLELTASDLRKFCAKRAFKIGDAFTDGTIDKWLLIGLHRSRTMGFRRESNRRRWVLAFAARECCESQAEGRDRVGYASRSRHARTFTDIMKRCGC